MHQKFPCFYPIFNLPPNVFHFNTAVVLSTRENIGTVYVIIPNIKYTYLDQDQCVDLLRAFGSAHPMMEITIQKSQFENPFEDIKNRFKKDPNLMAYIALDEKTARSSEFNEAFTNFHNLEIELVPSNFQKTSNKMRQAIETGDKKEFMKYIPEKLSPEFKEDCWNIVHTEISEQITSKQFWKKIITENIDCADEIFNIATTGMPNYDAMIDNPAYFFFFKDQSIALQWISPEDYMQLCASDVHDTTVEKEYESVDIEDVKRLLKAIESGKKLDTPILNADMQSQEGRHRSIAAAYLGYDKIPVYVISRTHEGYQREAISIIKRSADYLEAQSKLTKIGVPIDEKTYNKVRWQEAKLNDKK
jgi:hypothetical protein